MTRSRLRIRFTVGMSLLIFALFFIQTWASGLPIITSLLIAMMMGLMTAGLATISYGYKELLQRRAFAGKKQAGQSIENHQQRIVEIDVPMDTAFDLALDALKTLDKQRVPVPDDLLVRMEMLMPRTQHLRIRDADRASGIIHAGLRASTLKIPEFIDFSRITIRLEEVDNATTRINIESKANNIFDTYDMGKNMHYVNQLALYLRKQSQHLSAESRLRDRDIYVSDDADDDSALQQQSDQSL